MQKEYIDFIKMSRSFTEAVKIGSNGSKYNINCSLLKHYPYTDNTNYKGGMFGEVNLKNPPKRWFKKYKTKDQLINAIMSDVGRAMHYVVIYKPSRPWERQAYEAFAMWHVLSYGLYMWQPIEEIPKPFGKTALMDARAHAKEHPHTNLNAHVKSMAKHFQSYWPKNGRYVTTHKPIESFNMKQLRAIAVQVFDSFENMC